MNLGVEFGSKLKVLGRIALLVGVRSSLRAEEAAQVVRACKD